MTDTNPAKFNKLVDLLKTLFQLDQPVLHFGIYRIMHAKAGEVTNFLERDLLPQVKDAFASYQPADKAALQAELAKAIEQAQALGADPETLPRVKTLRDRIANEDQAIAGLLHDTIEDCGAAHEAIIRAQFGDAVADIVVACTDGTAEGKDALVDVEAKRRDWTKRKQIYLKHLVDASDSTLLVSACDKLHNARSIVQDLEDPAIGNGVFARFKAGKGGTLAYYESLTRTYIARGMAVASVLDGVVRCMHELAGAGHRAPLMVQASKTGS